jgi:hypothetical protein
MTVNLAEELLLLAYDDGGRIQAGGAALDVGLAGGLLLELILAGRIDMDRGRVVVVDPAATGDPVVDHALAGMTADDRARTPQDWVGRLGRDVREQVLGDLVSQNILRRERDKVLWVFPRTRYPSTTGEVPSAEADARTRLARAVDGTGAVEPRTAALCSLVRALRLEGTALTDRHRRRRHLRDRLRTVVQNWTAASPATVGELESVIAATVTASTVMTTTAASAH